MVGIRFSVGCELFKENSWVCCEVWLVEFCVIMYFVKINYFFIRKIIVSNIKMYEVVFEFVKYIYKDIINSLLYFFFWCVFVMD